MQNPGARWLGKAIGTQSSKGSPIAGDPGREEATRDETKRTGTIGTVSGGAEGAGARFEVLAGLEQPCQHLGAVSLPKGALRSAPGREIRMQSAGQLKKRATGRLRMLGQGWLVLCSCTEWRQCLLP